MMDFTRPTLQIVLTTENSYVRITLAPLMSFWHYSVGKFMTRGGKPAVTGQNILENPQKLSSRE